MSSRSVHLLCSSGGVRCFSYIGAYRALKQAGYTISGISASSMGSVIGMLICCGMSPDDIEQKIKELSFRHYLRKRFWIPLPVLFKYPYAKYKHPDYERLLIEFTGSNPAMKDLEIPYSTLALDLHTRQLLSFSRSTNPDMTAAELLTIATAIPPMFPPYQFGNRLLVDAGVATESPGWVAAAESNGKPVVVLRSSPSIAGEQPKGLPRFISNMIQSAAAGNDAFSLSQMPNAIQVDINCGNQEAEDFSINASKISRLILAGQNSMEKKLKDCNGELSNYIRVENIARQYANYDDANKANQRAFMLSQKFLNNAGGRRQIFISYSHKDTKWFEKIQLMLAPVEAFHGIKVWDDKEIQPGDRWHDAITQALQQTKIALCIVSPNFLNSNYITTHELKYFVEQSALYEVRLFLVAVSAIELEGSPLQSIQFAHDPSKPLDKMEEPDQHLVLDAIVDKLVKIMYQ